MRLFWMVVLAAAAFAEQPALFEYDRSVPFQYQEEVIRKDGRIEVASAKFQSPKGGMAGMMVVRPVGKGPFAGIVFQHGGGQSMMTYLAEAEVLARAGAISLILEAPGFAPGKWKPEEERSATEFRDYYAEIAICYRRAIDYLQSLKTVDPARIGFVGHSYGAIMGGALVAVDKRVKTFVLVGGVARYTRHISETEMDYWINWRKRYTPEQLAKALETIRPIDPDLYVGARGHGPILFQCGNFDFINVKACGDLHSAASAPKEVRWYDTDHAFADVEATFDRMQWLERDLHLKPVRPLLDRLWTTPEKRATALEVK